MAYLSESSVFTLVVCALYAIAAGWWTWTVVRRGQIEPYKIVRSRDEKRAIGKYRVQSLWTLAFTLNVVVLGAVVMCMFVSGADIIAAEVYMPFDPYVILGVEKDATNRQIKRAYRRLAVSHHPDKTAGDKTLQDAFIQISKAYAALTDPEAKRNMMLYGHPDGRQTFFTGIGLPSWIEHQNSQAVILVLYALVLAVAIPVMIYRSRGSPNQSGRRERRRSPEQEQARGIAVSQWLADGARRAASQSLMVGTVGGCQIIETPWGAQAGQRGSGMARKRLAALAQGIAVAEGALVTRYGASAETFLRDSRVGNGGAMDGVGGESQTEVEVALSSRANALVLWLHLARLFDCTADLDADGKQPEAGSAGDGLRVVLKALQRFREAPGEDKDDYKDKKNKKGLDDEDDQNAKARKEAADAMIEHLQGIAVEGPAWALRGCKFQRMIAMGGRSGSASSSLTPFEGDPAQGGDGGAAALAGDPSTEESSTSSAKQGGKKQPKKKSRGKRGGKGGAKTATADGGGPQRGSGGGGSVAAGLGVTNLPKAGGGRGEAIQNVDAALCASELAQCICQALLPRQHPIMQIPGVLVPSTELLVSGGAASEASTSKRMQPLLDVLSQALQVGEEELLARYLAGVFPGEGQALTEEQQRAVDKARPSRLAVPLTAAGLKGRAAVGVLEGEPAVVQERELTKLCSLDLSGAITQRRAAGVLRMLLLQEVLPAAKTCAAMSAKSFATASAWYAAVACSDDSGAPGEAAKQRLYEAVAVARWMPLADAFVRCSPVHRGEGIFGEGDLVRVYVTLAHLNAMHRGEVAAWVQEKQDRSEALACLAKVAWAEHEVRVEDGNGDEEEREEESSGGEGDDDEDEEEEETMSRQEQLARKALDQRIRQEKPPGEQAVKPAGLFGSGDMGTAFAQPAALARCFQEPMPLAHSPLYPGRAGAGWVVQVLDQDDRAIPLILKDNYMGYNASIDSPTVVSDLKFGMQVPLAFETFGSGRRSQVDPLQPHPLSLWLVFKSKAYRGLDFRVRLVLPVLPDGSRGL